MKSAFRKPPSSADLEKISKVVEDPNPVVPSRAAATTTTSSAIQEQETKVGGMLEVPLEKLRSNPFNARRVVSQTALDELASQLKTRGQDVAIMVYVDKEGQYCLIDGHRRLQAAHLAGLKTLRVDIRPQPANDKALYKASRQANKDRADQSPLDDALGWKMLLTDGVYATQAELADDMDISESVLSRTLGLADFPKTLVNQLGERPSLLNLRMLDAMKRYHAAAGDDATEAFIIEVVKMDLGSRDVDAARAALSKEPISRARSALQQIGYEKGNTTIRRFAGQGRLSIEIKDVVDEADIDTLHAALQKTIAEYLGSKQ